MYLNLKVVPLPPYLKQEVSLTKLCTVLNKLIIINDAPIKCICLKYFGEKSLWFYMPVLQLMKPPPFNIPEFPLSGALEWTLYLHVCGIIYWVQSKIILLSTSLIYCTFQKHANSEVQRPSDNIQKVMVTLWSVIGGFLSVLCVSMFQGSLLVNVIMIEGSEKRNWEGYF